jgi:hypothetical protein
MPCYPPANNDSKKKPKLVPVFNTSPALSSFEPSDSLLVAEYSEVIWIALVEAEVFGASTNESFVFVESGQEAIKEWKEIDIPNR